MIVPRYWAEARRHHRDHKRQVTVRRFGWSNQSQEAAELHAAQRADEAFVRVWAGEPLHRRDHKVAYNGADGLPIREEISAEYGDVVITRNVYGALCLNVEDVLIADVDFEGPTLEAWFWVVTAAAWWPLFLACRWLVPNPWGAGALASLLALGVSGIGLRLIESLWLRKLGGVEAIALRRIESFVDAHPHWRLRRYRTPMGFRLIVVHRTFTSEDADVAGFFAAIGADPRYSRMCELQRCFRARITPKPWRVGITRRLRPRPGVWPVKPEWLPARRQWVAEYEQASVGYAACRFEAEVGNGPVDQRAAALTELHDRLCAASSGLPIA